MIQAAIFDMDGLLLDTERLAAEGWRIAGRQMGFTISEEMLSGMRGLNAQTGRAYVLRQLGETFDYEAARLVRTTYVKESIAQNGIPLKPGVHELLDYLRSAGIPAALATSTARDQAQAWLEEAGIFAAFAASLCASEGGASKPAPDIFIKAAQLLAVPAAHCIVLEDSPNGLLAACRAGCMPVAIPDLDMPKPDILSQCFAHCETLLDVIPLIKRDREGA